MSSDVRPPVYDPRDAEADIAVIGMAGRFPGARNLEQFWHNIANGVESVARLSDAELAAAGVPESVRRSPDYVPMSSRLADVDRFDAEFFGYSPREAALLDPQGRLCLELAWHALEDAGYDPFSYEGAVGVFATASLSTYLLHNLAGRLDSQDFVLGLDNIPVVLGNGPDFVGTRVSYKLNLRGPSQAVQTACSSSLMAIHQARQSLLNGECDAALAGGVSVYLPQDRGYRWHDGMILAPDGHCRAFDAAADGIVFGRGGGMVVLKTVARALADGDRIRAIVKGSAANNDGSRKVGFTAPSVAGQARVIAEAMADAGVRADTISYVEAHGTGTKLGDPIEIAGLTEAYRAHTARTGYCAIGTVKTNIGHLDVAAGVTAFIKTVLMLEHGQLTPSLNFSAPNPAIDFASSPFYVSTALRPWNGIDGRRRAGVSAFGIGGTNVHVVLEGAPSLAPSAASARPMHLMRVTARTIEALSALCGDLAVRLAAQDAPSADDACYTANVGRAHHARRLVVRGATASELSETLAAASRGDEDARVVRGDVAPSDAPPVAFLFTGLGAQQVGMGAALFASEPVFRAALERCDALLRPHLERPLLSVVYPQPGESSPIDGATYGQPLMFAFEYALAELWKSWGIRPAAVLGHSLGEYAGATIAGLLPLDEGLRLVATRARLADTLPPGGGMAAAFASEAEVRAAIGAESSRVWIASINGPQNIVISGAVDALVRVGARLAERQVEVRMLNVGQAFHSPTLDPILDEYERAVARTRFGRAELPIISNVTGGVLGDIDAVDPGYWRRHAREVVRYADGVRTLYDRGIRLFLEIGPHTTATAMAAGCIANDDAVFLPSLRRGRDDFDQILETVSMLYVRGVDVDWSGMHMGRAGRRIGLPLYPFARTRHWIDAPAEDSTPARGALPSPYPLLGQAVRAPAIDSPVYELRVDPAIHPFLTDHRVLGGALLPATAFVEAALEAATRAYGPEAAGVVEDIEIIEPLPLPRGGEPYAQIAVRRHAAGFAFEVDASGAREGTAAWQRHATGRLRPRAASDATPNDRADVESIRRRCGAPISGADFYAALASRGFDYGPMFAGIAQLWPGDGEVLAEIRVPDGAHDSALELFRIHPAQLDSCLQSALALAQSDRTFLPLRIDSLDVRPGRGMLYAHAVRRGVSADASAFVCDVRVTGADGDTVAVAEGVALHEAKSTAATSAWRRWLYEPTWRESPALPGSGARRTAASNGAAPRWLVIGDEDARASFDAWRGAATVTAHFVSPASIVANAGAALQGLSATAPKVDAVVVVRAAADGKSSTDGTRLLLSTVQALSDSDATESARLWIATRGAQRVVAGDRVPAVFDAPMWGLANVVALEQPERDVSCADLDDDEHGHALSRLWDEVAGGSAETRVAYRRGTRFVERVVRASTDAAAAQRPRRLVVPASGDLSALEFVDTTRREPRLGEVEIEVRCAGLNFKDVLTALGRFASPPEGLGHECSGVVVSVGVGVSEFEIGDAVVAFVPGALATHAVADARLVAHMPSTLSFEEGATLSGAFLTAHVALDALARIGPDDRVLIHAATGGVGLAALQLAQRAGATVFATAGNDEKRSVLRARGVTNVHSSRTTDFATAIDAATGGRGVTIVLNSLTGELLERTVDVLAPRGRFIELGIGSAMSDRARTRLMHEAEYFNPNVAVDALAAPERFGAMLRDLVAAVGRGELRTLPHEAFDAGDVAGAFRLMARAGHIGKVVVRMTSPPVMIGGEATYLVVGGLGGIGQLVVAWLAEKGARHIAILSRRAHTYADADALAHLRERGVNVVVVPGDVSRRADVDAAIARIDASMPPLRGVFQAAGVLDDGALEQQTWDRFERVLAPKVDGAWNLHEALATRPLDLFILFSSLVPLLGSSGQGNHAAANAFLDALAAYRRARGRQALSINWGAWSVVGAAAARGVGERIASRGWGVLSPELGIEALEGLLNWPRAQVAVAPINWPVYATQFDRRIPPRLSELVGDASNRPPASPAHRDAATAGPSLADRVRALSAGERGIAVERFVRDLVGSVLGIPAARRIDPEQPLVGLGLDSLLAVELRNALNRHLGLGRRLPATLLFDYPSVAALSAHIHSLVDATVSDAAAIAANTTSVPAHAEVNEADIAAMSDAEAEALLLEELG